MRRQVLEVIACGLLAPVCAAQIVPPPPPAAEKTPAYEKPAEAAPVVAQPPTRPEPEAEAPLSSLVKKNEAGRLVPLDVNLEESAVELLDLDADTKARVQAGIDEHRLEMDRRVIENMALAIDLHKARRELSAPGATVDLARARDLAQRIKPLREAGLLDRLMSSNAITPRQRQRAELIVKEYKKAAADDAGIEGGADVQKTIQESMKRTLLELMGESDRSLVRLCAAAAPNLEALLKDAGLTAEQKAAIEPKLALLKSEKNLGDSRERRQREVCTEIVTTDLTAEQAAKVLKAANPKAAEAAGIDSPGPATPKN